MRSPNCCCDTLTTLVNEKRKPRTHWIIKHAILCYIHLKLVARGGVNVWQKRNPSNRLRFLLKISFNNKMLVLLFNGGTATVNKETRDFSMSNLFSREFESVAASSLADQAWHNRPTDEAYSEVNYTSCYQLKGDVCWADYILNRILMKYVAFFPRYLEIIAFQGPLNFNSLCSYLPETTLSPTDKHSLPCYPWRRPFVLICHWYLYHLN